MMIVNALTNYVIFRAHEDQDSTTGSFSWAPTSEQAGTYTLTFRVTDPTRRSAFETITITVSDVGTNLGPVCSAAYPNINEIWPPDHQPRLINIFGVTDPDNDPLTITIRRIFQDEPTNTYGDGSTWIDGGGLGTFAGLGAGRAFRNEKSFEQRPCL